MFKEHWDIARRKAGPLLGLMCTGDIMGYTPAMFFTVPFLVLMKSIEKAKSEGKEAFHNIKEMV